MIAFNPQGAILSFTSASSAPTSVQATSNAGVQCQQYCLTNTDSANDAVIGWGASDAEAKLNAVVASGSSRCYYLVHGSQVVVTAKADAYFTGIAVANTAVIKVQAGYGA